MPIKVVDRVVVFQGILVVFVFLRFSKRQKMCCAGYIDRNMFIIFNKSAVNHLRLKVLCIDLKMMQFNFHYSGRIGWVFLHAPQQRNLQLRNWMRGMLFVDFAM